MARAAAATAPRHAPRRATPARRPARRVSGHAAPRPVAPPGARVLDALLSGRVWIGLVGVLLAGIVFFNVDLLRMNREITQMADRAAQLKRENARLRLDVADLANSERIQQAAAELGLVLPTASEVRYLESNPSVDARTASKRIIPPDPTLAPDPIVQPTTIVDPTTTTVDPTTTTTPPTTTTTPPTDTTSTAASPTG